MTFRIFTLILGTLVCEIRAENIFADIPAKNRLVKALEKDKRKPSKRDISGVWSIGPNLCGYTIQLEQRGNSITGRGYHWGCLGVYDMFQVTGSYKKGSLSLTFKEAKEKPETYRFRYSTEGGHQRFERRIEEYAESIRPQFELLREQSE